ncbi:MAG: ribosomal RNA small subunit methyltransferase A [Planctomycetes bacterium]|nr:ribosomal RNA small subunit methyltransferase A [Planctomycetota bacterium]
MRAALAAHGAAPLKRHGQHFLLDDRLLATIVQEAGLHAGEGVLEVGPGPGLLTRHLLAAGAPVLAVEIDPLMRRVADDLIEPELRERLTWIESDVLAPGRRIAPVVEDHWGGCRALVANLPYSISATLLGALAVHPAGPERFVVMVQREVGERLLAGPGGKDFGPLAVLMALTQRLRRVRKVPPGAFWPVPKVDSVVIAGERRADRPPPQQLETLSAFLAMAFHNRRKTLPNSLAEASGRTVAEIVALLDLQENRQKERAEAMEALKLYDLSQRWTACAQGERHRPPSGCDRTPS